MRKGVKLAGLLAAGVAAFAVACSPVCNPAPVADPHGTPEQQWNWWRESQRSMPAKSPFSAQPSMA